ncbi:MAG: tripartite tricarboxylate transporter TctB family protein [Deltaproteobacteria bacterium]|nr:tripartite tricarboxylate transporter TctB family protein [Deltaproteobacteria bacterium]
MNPAASAEGEAGSSTLVKLKVPEFWCKVVLLAIFGAFYVAAAPYPAKARQFPQLLAAVSFVLTVVSLAVDLVRRDAVVVVIGDVDDTELRSVEGVEKSARRVRFCKAWVIILASAAAGLLGGFLFTSLLLFVGAAVLLGPREKLPRNLVVAAAVTAVIYFAFQRTMAVPMLDGLLW